MYSINFAATKTRFCLSLHYKGANSYLFVHGTKIIQFKPKDSEIVANPLRLRHIFEDFSKDNEILDIYKYLMEKNGII